MIVHQNLHERLWHSCPCIGHADVYTSAQVSVGFYPFEHGLDLRSISQVALWERKDRRVYFLQKIAEKLGEINTILELIIHNTSIFHSTFLKTVATDIQTK